MTIKKNKLIVYIYFVTAFFLVVLEILNFSMLSQVEYLFAYSDQENKANTVVELIKNLHPHALRAALMYPIYFVSDVTDVSLNIVFGVVVISLFYFVNNMIAKMTTSSTRVCLLLVIFFSILLVLINGRISFAIFGNTLILFSIYQRHHLKSIGFLYYVFTVVVGFIFCNVSSGTAFVSVLFLFVFYLIKILLNIKIKDIFELMCIFSAMLFMFKDLLSVYLNKNLDFYDGSFLLMLSHGLGKYIPLYSFLLLPLFLTIGVLLLFRFRNYPFLIAPFSLILSSLCVGMFGISSLVSGLSGFITILILHVKTNTKKQHYS